MLLFRFFDVAEELDLDRAPQRLEPHATVRRVSIRRETSAALSLETLPVELDLGPRALPLRDGTELDVTVRVRLFRFGVVAVVFEIPIATGTTLDELVPLAASTWESRTIDDLARGITRELADPLAALAGEPLAEAAELERYAVVFVRGIAGDPLAHPETVARLLLGESDARALSRQACEHVLSHRFRYFDDDLAIVHATSALVIEPTGDRDVVLALELECSQLLEFRVYDALIDRELDRVYDELDRATRRGWWIFGRAHEALSRRAQLHMVELSELADRAESACASRPTSTSRGSTSPRSSDSTRSRGVTA